MKSMMLSRLGYFDAADRNLLAALDKLMDDPAECTALSRLFQDDFHPLGIAELAAPRAVRLVGAMYVLLNTPGVEPDAIKIRLAALSALNSEAFEALGAVRFKRNAARVLLAIAKDLVRTPRDDNFRRLELAHRLHYTMVGAGRFIRRMLRHYQLLEMPESGNQLAFDYHVHDANSKGRKYASHLVLDAWIKGIRVLETVYYEHISRIAASEFLQAAAIMHIKGIAGEAHQLIWRGGWVEFICSDNACDSVERYFSGIDSGRRRQFRSQCRLAASYRSSLVYRVLDDFNRSALARLNRDHQLELAPVTPGELAAFAPGGHPTVEHIAELLLAKVQNALPPGGGGNLSAEALREHYFNEKLLAEIPGNIEELPELMQLKPRDFLERYNKVVTQAQVTLNLSGLTLPDVIELLWECRGKITDLEIFNLKDMEQAAPPDHWAVNQFRMALNQGNVSLLKKLIREAAEPFAESDPERRKKLLNVLKKLSQLIAFYQQRPLGARGGSDSAGRASRWHGMGLAVLDTLPASAAQQIRREASEGRQVLVWRCQWHRRISYWPMPSKSLISGFGRLMHKLGWRKRIVTEFVIDDAAAALGSDAVGNVVTLGGITQSGSDQPRWGIRDLIMGLLGGEYYNHTLKNTIKIAAGFTAAFLSFYYSDHAVLRYLGAPIWLGITGIRNVMQSLLGGGRRNSETLPWQDLVSMSRIADSLFYTGLSVPILENLVKNFFLGELLEWSPTTHSLGVFTVLAAANSLYILTHNLYRRLPALAVAGNAFRPLLAIPVSMIFGWLFYKILVLCAMEPVSAAALLSSSVAIISKLASDCVGGVIEGYADSEYNRNCRVQEYENKFRRIFDLALRLELIFPKKDAARLISRPKALFKALDKKAPELTMEVLVNALDLFYFAMCKPLSISVFKKLMQMQSPEDRALLAAFSQMLADDRKNAGLIEQKLVSFKYIYKFYSKYYSRYLKLIRKALPNAAHPPLDDSDETVDFQ